MTFPKTVGSSLRNVPDLCMVGGGGGTGGNGLLTETKKLLFMVEKKAQTGPAPGGFLRSVFIGEGLRTVTDLIGDVTLLSNFLGELVRLSVFNGELHRLSFFL